VGLKAYEHPAVRRWWRWLLEDYRPEYSIALITPCSNVKPYTRSPVSRKIRKLLVRLNLWDHEADKPKGVAWLYLSDLLALVPYEKATHYPACCYELPPKEALATNYVDKVATVIAEFIEKSRLDHLVVFLPRNHHRIWHKARVYAKSWPQEHQVPYTIFSTRKLEEVLKGLIRGVPPKR
jgi:predicted RNA-binding protein